jgi:tryptophan-rich sensory protein
MSFNGAADTRPARSERPERGWRRSLLVLTGALALCLGVAAIGGQVTSTSVNGWYQELFKPGFTPPDWVFAPVWTLLYVLMAVAAWRLWWRHGFSAARVALALFGVQLALNLAWSILFFGLNSIGGALLDMVALWLMIVATVFAFWVMDKPAGVLLLPYLAWVTYAAVLNAAIWRLN